MSTKTANQPILEHLSTAYLTLQLTSIRKTFEIPEYIIIGREAEAPSEHQIDLHDPFVSTRHCRIEKRQGQYWARDLRSRNGTYLNGTQITEALLQDSDRLRVGETEFIFSTAQKDWAAPFLLQSKNIEWQKELDRLPLYARSNLPVLVNGASGSGKEIIARSVHSLSNRSKNPFISVNCSALTESLIESELFGHVRGSFTGAAEDRKGAFLSAKGGTLFLDEIGDLPASLQPKLLRALENQEIKPVGSDRPLTVDVRIVAATHKDLGALVKRGQFRQDLYYRLNVLHVPVPQLRDRLEDFSELVQLFCKNSRVTFTNEAVSEMKSYSWPGQVRELKNFIARAGALYSGQFIEAEQVSSLFENSPIVKNESIVPKGKSALRSMEIQLISEKLVENRGNIRKCARELGLPKSTLYDRIKSYEISVKDIMAAREARLTAGM